MKRLLLISLICILVFGLVMTGLAKVNLVFFQRPYIAATEDKELGWYEKEVIAEFEEKYPEVEIELILHPWKGGAEKLEMLIATDSAPDIVYYDSGMLIAWMERGLLYDFEEVFTEEEKAEFIPSMLQMSTNKEGKFSILPWGIGVRGLMCVNVDLAKKAGAYDMLPIDNPDRRWTPEEFEAFLRKCKPLTEEGIYPYYMGYVGNWCDRATLTHLRHFGATAFEGNKTVLNSPEAVEGLEWLIHLNDEGLLYPNPESLAASEVNEAILNARIICSHANPRLLLQKRFTDKWEGVFVMFPIKGGIETTVDMNFLGMVVFDNGDLERGKYAKLFAKFWCSKDPTIANAFWPKLTGGRVFENESLNYYGRMGATCGGAYNSVPYFWEYRVLFEPEMQAAFTHLKTAKEALDDLVEKVNKLAEEY